ncbi:hypothetical protein [Streptomyces sp. NPDC057496]|uniref:hypothetical protein n=1 Tax=Streptomyces sp. NPDC057496 TaxID=3346149 RepID=UPI0036C9112D
MSRRKEQPFELGLIPAHGGLLDWRDPRHFDCWQDHPCTLCGAPTPMRSHSGEPSAPPLWHQHGGKPQPLTDTERKRNRELLLAQYTPPARIEALSTSAYTKYKRLERAVDPLLAALALRLAAAVLALIG